MADDRHEVAGTAERLAEFAGLLTGEHQAEDLLARLTDYCTDLLPLHGAGVLLRDENDDLTFATANTEVGHQVEQLEVDLREGPCTEALRRGERVLVPDLRQVRDRYPRFVPAALDLGVHSVSGVPMSVRGGAVGVLDLISLEPLELQPAEATTAQLLADVAISYVENSRMLESRSQLSQQLQHALNRRVVIEQAKGLLSERHGVSLEEAFELLRTEARSRQQSVRRLAELVLSGQARI